MTFSQWYRKQPTLWKPQYTDSNGCRVVYIDTGYPGYQDLWALKDYKVSTVGGSVLYLVYQK